MVIVINKITVISFVDGYVELSVSSVIEFVCKTMFQVESSLSNFHLASQTTTDLVDLHMIKSWKLTFYRENFMVKFSNKLSILSSDGFRWFPFEVWIHFLSASGIKHFIQSAQSQFVILIGFFLI